MQKHSLKRDAICEALLSKRDHPTADMVYSRAKEKYPDMSLATVYRNLSLLYSEGKIIKIGAPGKERYDIDITPHSHFFCDICGEVYDVFSPVSASDFDHTELETGGKINNASIAFRGICKRCLDNKNNNKI